METGLLQKRKHLPGWDISLFQKERSVPTSIVEYDDITADPVETVPKKQEASDPCASIDLNIAAEFLERPKPEIEVEVVKSEAKPVVKFEAISEHADNGPEQEQEIPKKKWNKFAIPAFIAALATLYLGFFGTSTIAVIIALGVTFILSGISLRQIRSRDEAGKGFALAALMIGVIAAVATAIVTYAIGFI